MGLNGLCGYIDCRGLADFFLLGVGWEGARRCLCVGVEGGGGGWGGC